MGLRAGDGRERLTGDTPPSSRETHGRATGRDPNNGSDAAVVYPPMTCLQSPRVVAATHSINRKPRHE